MLDTILVQQESSGIYRINTVVNNRKSWGPGSQVVSGNSSSNVSGPAQLKIEFIAANGRFAVTPTAV